MLNKDSQMKVKVLAKAYIIAKRFVELIRLAEETAKEIDRSIESGINNS